MSLAQLVSNSFLRGIVYDYIVFEASGVSDGWVELVYTKPVMPHVCAGGVLCDGCGRMDASARPKSHIAPLESSTEAIKIAARQELGVKPRGDREAKYLTTSTLISTALPKAHTCFNKLDLPLFESEEEVSAAVAMVLAMDMTGFTMD